jgi:predicted O-methyltransferase YrrM
VQPALQTLAEAATGFMPPDEGLALHDAALAAGRAVPGAPFVEIGSWCGKSSIYIGAAARASDTVLFAVDHHRGSEENQAGWEHHDPELVDHRTGTLDTLPRFRHTVWEAGLEGNIVAVVGDSPTVAAYWGTPCAFLFIDGGHGDAPAHADYDSWSSLVADGGTLAIHDVFPDPADGGRPPYEVYLRALEDGFVETSVTGSLRVLVRTPRS